MIKEKNKPTGLPVGKKLKYIYFKNALLIYIEINRFDCKRNKNIALYRN